MNMIFWRVISNISLVLGIILMIAAIALAFRYKIFSMILSDSGKKTAAERSSDTVTPIILKIPERDTETEYMPAAGAESGPDDNATMVVRKKKNRSADSVIGGNRTEEKKEDFVITRNILVISADPDVVDR